MARFTVCLAGVLALSCVLVHVDAAAKLEIYNVDRNEKLYISGLSSGGAFAMQFHVAFSGDVDGAGILAGIPYACAKGGLISTTTCMNSPGTVNANTLISEINSQASGGKIDPVSNLSGDKVFIFHGSRDSTVGPASAGKVKDVYEAFGVATQSKLDIAAVHGFPTNFYGAACGSSSALTQYINNCDYHGAFHTLNYLYDGQLIEPTGTVPLNGQFSTFDQNEFNGGNSMDAEGYIYVPSGCVDKTRKCKFHISVHGCQQSKGTITDTYAKKTGYLEVAELNNIIVIFPQAKANVLAGNPNACWDWWGYGNANFLNKAGAQMQAIHKMLVRVAKCDGAASCFEGSDPDPDPPTTTTVAPPTTTSSPGRCQPNEVSFHAFPGLCQYYTMCACSSEVLLQCAPGLYFDPTINNCNFQQLVDCENSVDAKTIPEYLKLKRSVA